MATATFYSFSKRHNSTKTPTGGTDITVYLKGGSDLLTPTFTLEAASIPAYNYMKFSGRYYFITGIRSIRDKLYEIEARVDVLATYKADIQASSPYVLYYTHSNSEIADKRLSVKATQTTQTETGSFGFLGKNHCYILTVIGKDKTTAYALNQAQIDALYGTDYQDAFDYTVYDIPDVQGAGFADTIIDCVRWFKDFLTSSAGAFNYAGTISENIRSCIILPVAIGAIGGSAPTDLLIGAVDTGIDGKIVTDRTFTDTATVTIPWQASDWRRLQPYHEVYLYVPAIGLITISASDVIGVNSLTVKVSMDVLSGDAIFEVKAGGKTVYYSASNLATQYALGASQTNYNAVANSIISAIAHPQDVLSNTLGLANSLQPSPSCIGSNTGGAILGIDADTIACYTVFHDTAVTPGSVSAEKGTPYNGVLSLSGVTGYVQTGGASVAGSMTDTEREDINGLMDGGIYLE